MFLCVEEAIAYIESKRSKHTLEQFSDIVTRYHCPMPKTKMVHVAGTNGKGSTVNYLRHLLNAHGYHVGTFTSPYLISHHDRLCIDGQPIKDQELLMLIEAHYDMFEKENLSMFECDVCLMLSYFSQKSLDYLIVETGMGGRFDKTNIIQPCLSVITHIGYDHQSFLGETLKQIAYHKAGIIKEGVPVICSEQDPVLKNIFIEEAHQKHTHVTFIEPYTLKYPYTIEDDGRIYELGDVGSYQMENAKLALMAYKMLGCPVDEACVRSCLKETQWPGRFEKVHYLGHDIYLDGAHNEDGILALIQTLESRQEKNVSILFSALKDKEVQVMLDRLLEKGYHVYVTTFEDERHIDLDTCQSTLTYYPCFEDGLHRLLQDPGRLVITGSLHFISYVRHYLKKEA